MQPNAQTKSKPGQYGAAAPVGTAIPLKPWNDRGLKAFPSAEKSEERSHAKIAQRSILANFAILSSALTGLFDRWSQICSDVTEVT